MLRNRMKILFKILILLTIIAYWSTSIWTTISNSEQREKNYFQFAIPNYHSSRQWGQVVNVYVRYAYKSNLPSNKYPDYRLLRKSILIYLEPTAELPAMVYWEIIATKMGKELMKNFPLQGVSVQLEVLNNPNPEHYEPGNHGPTYTEGTIQPLDIHL